MLKGFKDFVLRGNVIDLAIAVVVGAAFSAVINAVVKGLITPLIGAIIGKPSFDDLTFTIHKSVFLYGSVLNELITFVSVAAVLYFAVVNPLNLLEERRKRGVPPESPNRACPECFSDIPKEASRCAFCTTQVTPVASV